MKEYFLSSLDSYKFQPVRKCQIIKEILTDGVFDVILVEIDPFVLIDNKEVSQLLLTNRFEGDKLCPISKLPLFVNILLPEMEKVNYKDFKLSDLPFMATGELYKTSIKAENHIFD